MSKRFFVCVAAIVAGMSALTTILTATLSPARAEPVPLARAEPVPLARAEPVPLARLVDQVDIAYRQFTLPNGLRVVVHTDRKAPVVHVGVWYHVGSVDEPLGRSGFAHLFEHLMFYGSAHHPGEYFKPLEAIGATDYNGTTSFDRTNYFQTVPTPALDLALFLESDRMGWLLPAVTQDKLDAQRKVVLNEKRQGDNQPGGLVQYEMLSALFPPDHPLAVSPIGKPADLAAATLGDVRGWFASHYGPNNAVLVLAGDIDPATAREKVEHWFGQIPAGPTPARFAGWVPELAADTRTTMHDRVATARLYRYWPTPGRADSAGNAALDTALAILASGPTARLTQALVRDERLAVAVGGGLSTQSEAGVATIVVNVAPGVDPQQVEARVDALLAEFLRDGPTADEVARVAMRAVSGTIRGLEEVGGFDGKGVALAEGLLFHDDPGFFRRELADYAAATPARVQAAARQWLARPSHRLTLLPGARDPTQIDPPESARRPLTPARPAQPSAPVGVAADRTHLPDAGPAGDFTLPPIEHAQLSNGVKVIFARQTAVPVVRLMLSLPGGIAADSRALPGLGKLTLGLLDEGSAGRLGTLSGPEIAARAERLGALITAGQTLDRWQISLNALTPNLADSLALFADVVRRPTFPAGELERMRVQALTALKQEETQPAGLAWRALPALLYGGQHPYGQSFTGSGTEAGLNALTRSDVQAFHARMFDPKTATILVVGDMRMADLLPVLDAAIGDWQATGGRAEVRQAAIPPQPTDAGRILLIDRPGAEQSVIVAGRVLPLAGGDDILAASLANDIFGGLASARLNQSLRETHNWSYGAYSSLSPTRGPMPFIISAPVETAETGNSLKEIRRLLADYKGPNPPGSAEVAAVRANMIRALPGDFETGGALLGALARNVNLGRPDTYLETLVARLADITTDAVRAAPIPRPDQLVYVVVGDRAVVEPQLRDLGAPVEILPAP